MDPSIVELLESIRDEQSTLNFCQSRGLIPSPPPRPKDINEQIAEYWGVCSKLGPFNQHAPECPGTIATRTRTFQNGPKYYWRCCKCRKTLSQQNGTAAIGGKTSGTFFSMTDSSSRPNCKLSKRAVIWILYCWVNNLTVKQTCRLIKPTEQLQHQTVVCWRNYLRKEMMLAQQRAPRMGGPESMVEIGELVFRPSKSQNGRRKDSQSDAGEVDEDPWLFGMICRDAGELRLFYVTRRNAKTLMPLIIANVAPGTTIFSVESANSAYSKIADLVDLSENGGAPMQYRHQAVSSNVRVQDPVTEPHALHIQRALESSKLQLLRLQRSTIKPALLQSYLATFWWLSTNGSNQCHNPFNRLIDLIRHQYPQV